MIKETSRLKQEQLESLTEIGAYLRQVREDCLLSLDEIASRTMIQARLLRAIEEGRLEKLPEPVYIQGFIRLYADALGLNGTEFADAFPTERQLRVASASSWKDSPAAQLRPMHLYLAYVALIVASVSLLSHIVNRSAPIPSSVASPLITPQNSISSTVARQSNKSTPGVSTTGAAMQSNSKNPSASVLSRPSDSAHPVRVDVNLTAQSWLRVVIDGETEFEGVLPEGTTRTWQAKNQLTVRAGNAGGVMLAYNQGEAERMGAPGAVEEKTFTLTQDAASLPNPEVIPIQR